MVCNTVTYKTLTLSHIRETLKKAELDILFIVCSYFLSNQGVWRLHGARGKKQVWRPHVRNWGLMEANSLYSRKFLWHCWALWDFFQRPQQTFGARGIVPLLSLRRYAPDYNTEIKLSKLRTNSIMQYNQTVKLSDNFASFHASFSQQTLHLLNLRFTNFCAREMAGTSGATLSGFSLDLVIFRLTWWSSDVLQILVCVWRRSVVFFFITFQPFNHVNCSLNKCSSLLSLLCCLQ